MQLALYRSKVHETYPDETMLYCYSFQPIEAEERNRNGQLLSWTDDSGLDPFVWIEAPDGTRIRHSGQGWQLQVPGTSAAIDADEVYDLAMERVLGLSIVREPSTAEQRHDRVM
jgi:hypothetical protein